MPRTHLADLDKGGISDAALRNVYEKLPELSLVLTPTFEIVAATDSMLDATSTGRQQIVGKSVFEVFPGNPEDPSATGESQLRDSLSRVLETRLPHAMAPLRYDIRLPGDIAAFEFRYWRPSNTPVLDNDGDVQWIIHRSEDITAIYNSKKSESVWEDVARGLQGRADEMESELVRREAAAAVLAVQRDFDRESEVAKEALLFQYSEQKFKSLFEIAPDAMLMADFDGTIVLLNNHAETLFGYRRGELLGQKIEILIPARFRVGPDAHLADSFDSHSLWTSGQGVELIALRNDGSEFPFEVSLSPIETLAGVLTISAIRDLSERKRQDIQLMRAQRLESIGTFAGNIAHDMNNALAPILMSLELLKIQNPDSGGLVNVIESGANRGAEMLRQLLVFSKGSFVEPKLLQLEKVLDDVSALVKSTFPKSIKTRITIAESLYPILGDSTQIHQVLMNLCLNSKDAMPDGGLLTLQAENVEIDADYASRLLGAKPGSYVRIRVSDTGTGIPANIIDQIFEPFFSTKGHGKGTGLGLSIVVGIVKSHQGFLNAYSTPSKGSSFVIYLPVDTFGFSADSTPRAIQQAFRGNGETILIVDDSQGLREVGKAALQAMNLHVITAGNGEEALEVVAKVGHKLKAVITDVHMPEMDGLTFVTELRKVLPHVGVIVMSGNLDEIVANKFKELGVSSFIEKPFDQERLTTALSLTI